MSPSRPENPFRVVFLCTGNAARSVMATTIANAANLGSGVEFWGGGTHSIEGLPMSSRTRNALRLLHLENHEHRSHQFSADDAARADLVVAFEPGNVAWIRREHPEVAAITATIGHLAEEPALAALLSAQSSDQPTGRDALVEAIGGLRLDEVAIADWPELIDPAGGDQDVFNACVQQVDALLRALLPVFGLEKSVPAESTALLVPVKAFSQAKARLSADVSASERARLARDMATHVVTVAAPLPVAIACDDEEVADWATSVGAQTIWAPGTDLNGAVQEGLRALGESGFGEVIIAHSDLPLAPGFTSLAGWPGVTLVPDRHRTGSNVMVVPTDSDFTFAYGAGSFRRHVAEAVRIGRGLRIVHQAQLAWDVDFPDDLEFPSNLRK